MAILAAILAVTTLLDAATLGLVYVLAAALGLVTVVDNPARQAFVTDLVPPEDYVNAQAINSTIHNAGRLIGPAVAGLLIAAFGAGPAFAVNACSFVAVLFGLARIDRSALYRTARLARGKGQVRAGLRSVGVPVSTYAGEKGLDVRSDLGTLNLADVPSVMVELGNMRDRADARRMTSPRGRASYVRGLGRAVVRYLR